MNGADCAMACAVAAGASWIRVFEWCNAFVSQSGFINAMGANVSRMRSRLKADQILALCDVNVKHGSHYIIHDRSVAEQDMDIESQDGDAVIVTGFDTGTPPSVENIYKCKKSTSLPILIGSSLNSSNVNELLTAADGAIIGSWFKEGNNWKNATEHICLAAAEQGLGTCWVCNFDTELCRKHFKIPEMIEPVVLIPFGYPSDPALFDETPKKRKPIEEIIKRESF